MEELVRTGRLPGELRSTTTVKEVIPEKTLTFTRPSEVKVEHTFYGPCLRCGRDMQYGEYHLSRFQNKKAAEEWLLLQFSPARRSPHISMLEGRRQTGPLLIESIESIVCEPCRIECAPIREKTIAERTQRKEERQRRRRHKESERAARWQFERTWREAGPGEVKGAPEGRKDFRAVIPGNPPEIQQLSFRWRPVAGQCLGSRGWRNAVGMWVRGKLVAHYEGWTIDPGFSGYYKAYDVFASGLCIWLSRVFQRQLLRIEPDISWDARGRCSWRDEPAICDFFPSPPCVMHTRWIDGTTVASIWMPSSSGFVIDFAADKLGVRIEPV